MFSQQAIDEMIEQERMTSEGGSVTKDSDESKDHLAYFANQFLPSQEQSLGWRRLEEIAQHRRARELAIQMGGDYQVLDN